MSEWPPEIDVVTREEAVARIEARTGLKNPDSVLANALSSGLIQTYKFLVLEYIGKDSLNAWISDLLGEEKISTPPPAKPKAVKDRSFGRADAPLIEKMHPHVLGGMSPWAAALLFVDEAKGGGNAESKQRRLQKAYSLAYGE